MTKKLTLYHNSECSKCRGTLDLLQKSGVPYDIVEYLKTPPSAETLNSLLKQLGKEPREIVRDHEEEFAELQLDRNPPRTREDWLRMLVQNPILIERPIVTDGTRAVIGRPPENVLQLLPKP